MNCRLAFSTIRWIAVMAVMAALVLSGQYLLAAMPPAAGLAAGGFQDGSVVKGVRVYGHTRFTSREILRASGLRMGERVTDATMDRVQRKLIDSGAFISVDADDFPGMGGTVLHFSLTDMHPLAACDFSRIPGVNHQRLVDELKDRVPLFDGRIPIATPTMLNTVKRELGEILRRDGVHGTVADTIDLGTSGGRSRVIFYLKKNG